MAKAKSDQILEALEMSEFEPVWVEYDYSERKWRATFKMANKRPCVDDGFGGCADRQCCNNMTITGSFDDVMEWIEDRDPDHDEASFGDDEYWDVAIAPSKTFWERVVQRAARSAGS